MGNYRGSKRPMEIVVRLNLPVENIARENFLEKNKSKRPSENIAGV